MPRPEKARDSLTRAVTDNSRDQEDLGGSESLLRSVFHAAPIGIAFTRDRMIARVNETGAELAGYSAEELLGKSTRIFYETDEEYERVGRILAHGGDRRTCVETRLRRKDGTTVLISLTGAWLDATDPSAGYVVTLQDITERKRAEEALRESEDRFRGLVEQSPMAIQVLSAEGDSLVINGAFQKLWGLTNADLKGYNILRDRQIEALGFMPVVRRAFAGERIEAPIVEYDAHATLGAGGKIYVQGVFYPVLDASGALRYIILVHLDWTERVRAEEEKRKLQEQLQQAMKMEAVGRLAGGVAHDFNNLLTTIAGNVELARLDLLADHPISEYLVEIAKAAASAASLTRQLLAFSRQQVIEPKIVDLNDLVSGLKMMMGRLIGEDIELRTVQEEPLGAVKVDPGQFEQVLVNLVVNARDAMPSGGKLLLETANRYLDEHYCSMHSEVAPGPYVLLAVSDSGQGMTAEVKQRIFEPFFTTKPRGRGTGLGLATIFGIVRQAAGTIEVYSEVGLGTTFKVFLPRVDQPADKLQSTEDQESFLPGSETVLLVEDDDSVRNVARNALRMLGYNVLCAATGAEALRIAQSYSERLDLLLTDVVMPGMNGRELAEKLTALRPETKVLYTSGYTEDVIHHHGVLAPNLYHIAKPYSLKALSKKIREVLEKTR